MLIVDVTVTSERLQLQDCQQRTHHSQSYRFNGHFPRRPGLPIDIPSPFVPNLSSLLGQPKNFLSYLTQSHRISVELSL